MADVLNLPHSHASDVHARLLHHHDTSVDCVHHMLSVFAHFSELLSVLLAHNHTGLGRNVELAISVTPWWRYSSEKVSRKNVPMVTRRGFRK